MEIFEDPNCEDAFEEMEETIKIKSSILITSDVPIIILN